MSENTNAMAGPKARITKAEAFNGKMDELFYNIPGCWYGSMPNIDKTGTVNVRGHIALDPEKAAIGIAVLSKHFNLFPGLENGQVESGGQRSIRVGFYLKAEDEARALIASIPLRKAGHFTIRTEAA